MFSRRHRVDGDLIVNHDVKNVVFPVYKQYTKISRHSSYPDMDFKTY